MSQIVNFHNLLKGIPLKAQVAAANSSETTQLESTLFPDKLYCLDAGYREYRLLDKIILKSSFFVVRLQDNASYEIIEEHSLSEADLKAGIEFDRTVWIGSKQKRSALSKPIRIIQFTTIMYFQGWATLEELIEHIEGLKPDNQKQQ
jgi:hypothetical protein